MFLFYFVCVYVCTILIIAKYKVKDRKWVFTGAFKELFFEFITYISYNLYKVTEKIKKQEKY